MYKNLLLFAILLAIAASCSSDSEADVIERIPTDVGEQVTTVTYTNTIGNMITEGCSSTNCHGGGRSPLLTSYEQIKTAFQATGTWSALGRIESGNMPKNGAAFSQTSIDKIKDWIANGYPKE
jgi:citrate lyase alpha subunit